LSVPLKLKKLLTSIQITQFLVGILYAPLHLIIGFRELDGTLRSQAGNEAYSVEKAYAAGFNFTPDKSVATNTNAFGMVTTNFKPCVQRPEVAFAIILNVAYLIPLT
jgi:hypothetical protein